MDSIANTIFGATTITHQPSSLSLNDMEELEMQCMAESHSEQNLIKSEDNLEEEPEAVIVEIEDLVEETASPLLTHILESKRFTPIYRTEVVNLWYVYGFSHQCNDRELKTKTFNTYTSNTICFHHLLSETKPKLIV